METCILLKEAAKITGYSHNSLRRLALKGIIPFVKENGYMLVNIESIQLYSVEKRKNKVGAPLGSPSTRGQQRKPLEERFWSKVHKTTPNECWLWTGKVRRDGYGSFTMRSHETCLAHRMAYKLHYGDLPDKLFVCHHCDNPPCCNPQHLFLGTAADNSRDCKQKGRIHPGTTCGENHPLTKLKTAEVLKIRELATQHVPQRTIAKQFNISQTQIWHIIHRLSWRHI